jgi:tetratricopeptide (TPR) repeat protein
MAREVNMFSKHPSAEDLEQFLRGTSRAATRSRNGQVVHHLLADCSVCRNNLRELGWEPRRLMRLLEPQREGQEEELLATANGYDYSRAFAAVERTVSSLLMPERLAPTSAARLSELAVLSAAEQIQRVTADKQFAEPAVIRTLVEHSHAVRFQNAEEMLRLAHLARLAADACSLEDAGNELKLADLRARAWGQYGNALRVSGRPREAEEALGTARRHLKEGTGDPMLRAWLLERIAPLSTFQGRFSEAIEICDERSAIYQELGESHLFASTLVQKAIALLNSGEAEAAVRTLNQAIPLINHEEDPHLLLAACHNLIRCYIDLDRPEQALLLYFDVRELYQESSDPLILLRAAWQEGQLLRDLGHLRAAESALLRARKGYQDRKLSYEVALVSLDLASVYVKLGLVEELKRTVLTTLPIFHALRVGLETLAALLQLQQVADQEQQALELIRTLNARIEPLRRQRIEER